VITSQQTGLYYEVVGEGSPVVLVHAGIADSRMWDPQWVTFPRSHRVVRYDMRGFGRSPLAPGRYAPPADLIALRRVPPRFFGVVQSVHPVLAALAGLLSGEGPAGIVVRELRLPRTLLALMMGATLGLSGAASMYS